MKKHKSKVELHAAISAHTLYLNYCQCKMLYLADEIVKYKAKIALSNELLKECKD